MIKRWNDTAIEIEQGKLSKMIRRVPIEGRIKYWQWYGRNRTDPWDTKVKKAREFVASAAQAAESES